MLDNFGHVIKQYDSSAMYMKSLCATFDLRLSKGHIHNIDMDDWPTVWSGADFLSKPIRPEEINLGFTCMHGSSCQMKDSNIYIKNIKCFRVQQHKLNLNEAKDSSFFTRLVHNNCTLILCSLFGYSFIL